MTTRYERLKMQRRMQRRIQLVVEERRMTAGLSADRGDPEATIELPARAVGRVTIDQI